MQQIIIFQQDHYFSPENQRFRNKMIDYAFTDQKSSFLTLLLKSIHDWNIRLPHFFLCWCLFHGMVQRHSESIFLFFIAQKEIPSYVLFRGMVRNGTPRTCIYFGSTERNSELCSLPQKSSEQNYRSLLLFLFHGTEFRVVFSSAEGFGRNSEIFCSAEIPNPNYAYSMRKSWLGKIVRNYMVH